MALTGASGAGKSTLMRMVQGNYRSSAGRITVVGVDVARAEALLARLNIPRALWALSPTTFSDGEQQLVNIARGFVHAFPVMLTMSRRRALIRRTAKWC